MNFTADITAWAAKAGRNAEQAIRMARLDLASGVIRKTPVDEGRARGNWQSTTGSPAVGEIERMDKSGAAAVAEAQSAAAHDVAGVFWLVNHLSYIRKLEYGGYPKQPKRGTWNKFTKQYEIRSIGGFSKQAPQGMLRLTVAEFQAIVA